MALNKVSDEAKISFRFWSNNAARLERQGLFAEAGKSWLKAGDFAKNQANQRWCECRAVFCGKRQFFKGGE